MMVTAQHSRGDKLEALDVHLLGWLLAYPASSAQELASVFDLHPATVYRHLGRILEAGWLQRVTGYGGGARFLFSPYGTVLLAQVLQQDVEHPVSTWQHGKSAPPRILPRLLAISRLHTFARRFFQDAPLALAHQGHPVLVRWHLMRDWQTHLQITPNRLIRVQAQAVLAWTVTGSPQDASHLWATEKRQPTEARWQSALILLESGLCDADLITARLRALLRYRTALQGVCELGSQTPSVAPLLVLVENERQLEVWRRAARHAARHENTEPLAGAIARLNEGENVWQWPWRDLATGAHLRLASCFASLIPGSLPEGVRVHLVAVQDLMTACDRINEAPFVQPVGPIDHPQEGKRQARPPVARMVPSPRQRELLTQLARTPYMTAEEIAAVLPRLSDGESLAPASIERLLRELARQSLAQRELVVQGQQAVWRWHLTESGLRQVASLHEVSLRYLSRLAERNRFVMQRQGAHQAGVYSVIAAFHQSTHTTAGAITVLWWECGRGAERTYSYHGIQRNLRPDAELELIWSQTYRRLRLWLEYDTGSMNRRDLERKMASYRDYWNSREWAAEGLAALPRLLFIVPHSGQEERIRRACCEMLSGVRLRVLVTTAAHLEASTPYGCIWRPIAGEEEHGRPERQALWK